MDRTEHWDSICRRKGPTQVSCYQPEARVSLDLIRRVVPDFETPIIDVGGGASTMVDGLLDAGYRAITVLDLAPAALALAQVWRAVQPGWHVIVASFGPEGPTRCSGLDVVEYSLEALHDKFGPNFRLLESEREVHRAPAGSTQAFVYCLCRVVSGECETDARASRANEAETPPGPAVLSPKALGREPVAMGHASSRPVQRPS